MLNTVETCSRQLDHQNSEGALSCHKCNPFIDDLFSFTLKQLYKRIFIEYFAAEKMGPWLRLAVDKQRFRRRIRKTELLIGDIFTDDHRQQILCYVNKIFKK